MENTIITPNAQLVIDNITQAVKNSVTGVTFVSITNYTNKQNETSNNLINVGINYNNTKQKDIEFLNNINLTDYTFKSDLTLLEQAKNDLINSLIKPNENISTAQINAYTNITNGIKVHNITGQIYIYGYRTNKTIINEGTYKETKSTQLTIAKNEIKKLLKTNKFTQFAIEPTNIIKTNKQIIEL